MSKKHRILDISNEFCNLRQKNTNKSGSEKIVFQSEQFVLCVKEQEIFRKYL